MGQYIASIDSGTQSTRVVIFDLTGKQVAKGSSNHPPMINPNPGWCEHGKNESWEALVAAAAEAFGRFKGSSDEIIAIGLSSQRMCMNVLDEKGEHLCNPISWMDSRWHSNIEELGEIKEDVRALYKTFLAYYSRANWLKINEPDIYEKATKYLNVTGYLGMRLTGECRDTISNNFGWPVDEVGWTGLLDDAHIKVMGFRREQLAEIIMPSGFIGKITEEAAAKIGFPVDCPLYASAGDKQCELLGAGVVRHGEGYITLGTLSGLDIVSSEYTLSPTFSYMTYLSAYPKNYNLEAAIDKGFWLVAWFRDNFARDLDDDAKKQGIAVEELLNREATQIPAGSNGLVVLPDWSAAGTRPNSKGMFIGLDGQHKRAHMYRALIEGIVMEIKNKCDGIQSDLKLALEELSVGGGGSRGDLCVQIIADVFNLPVRRMKESETTALGVAICAAVGEGIYASFDEAVLKMSNSYDVFTPNKKNHEKYEFLRNNVMNLLYSSLEPVMQNLAEFNAM